ncbi:MAG: DUF4342 domain-containing protein [Solobacterium sp.]|nr:DUF4342 domain-containing protein [Solobacterium sp.]
MGRMDRFTEETEKTAEELVEKIKRIVKEGNATSIRIRKDEKTVLTVPLTLGVAGVFLGAVAAPWALILSTIATIGMNCTVEIQNKDGSVTILRGK